MNGLAGHKAGFHCTLIYCARLLEGRIHHSNVKSPGIFLASVIVSEVD